MVYSIDRANTHQCCTPCVPGSGYPNICRSLTRVRENYRTAILNINDADKCMRLHPANTFDHNIMHSRRMYNIGALRKVILDVENNFSLKSVLLRKAKYTIRMSYNVVCMYNVR